MASFILSRSEEHTSELQSLRHLVFRLLLDKKSSGQVWITSSGVSQRRGAVPMPYRGARQRPVSCPGLSPPVFFNDPATTEIYTLSLHDALPICMALFNGFLNSKGSGGQQYPLFAW